MILVLATAWADPAPPTQDCELRIVASVPLHDDDAVPTDLDAALHYAGGCGLNGTLEVLSGTETVAHQSLVFASDEGVVDVEYDAWTPGPWSLVLSSEFDGVVEQIDFTVVDALADAVPPVVGTLEAYGFDGNALSVVLSLDEPDAYVLIAAERADGTRGLAPSGSTVEYWFTGPYSRDRTCLDVEGRGYRGGWSAPTSLCAEVVNNDEGDDVERRDGCGCTAAGTRSSWSWWFRR